MERPRADRWKRKLQIGAAALGVLVAWVLLLDLSKAPLLPQLEPSWIAGITFAAAGKLQFGRDIIYTYGPFGHLAFSSYSPALFTLDLLLEVFLKGTYVAVVCLLSRRLPTIHRACFLFVAFILAVLSYQTLYIFLLVCAAWILIQRSRTNDVLLFPVLLFVSIAALIKITFFWFALLVLATALVTCVIQRRFVRAIVVLIVSSGSLCAAWIVAGQSLVHFPDFVRTAAEVTSGYSKTMSLPCPGPVLTGGLAVSVLMLTQLAVLLLPQRRQVVTRSITCVLGAGLFLAWKLGFSRADAHTTEFFYYTALLAVATPLFYGEARKRNALINSAIPLAVVVLSIFMLLSRDPGIGSDLTNILLGRGQSNLNKLLHPSAEAAKWQAADLQNSQAFALPRIKQAVGQAPVDVFGYEQAIAILNGLNYRPIPTLQTYTDYTPALALTNAAFYRSKRAPEYVILKLQPIDNRLPTINCAEVLVRLLQDYAPLFAERGYLLLKRQKTSERPLSADLRPLAMGEVKIGEALPVPKGMIWCELQLKETFAGRLLGFLYHSPEVYLEIASADGEVTQRRILPALAGNGFLVNPIPTSESDFVQAATGHSPPNATTQSIKVVHNPAIGRLFKSTVKYRFSEISLPSIPKPNAVALARELRGYSDVFSTPAVEVKSGFPLERFVLEGKRFLLVHPIGEVRFDIPAGATAATGEFAMRPETYLGGRTDGVEFQVEYAPSNTTLAPARLYERMLQPLTVEIDRGIQSFRVDLPTDVHGQLILRTLPGTKGSYDWDWAGWSDVRFEPDAVSGPVESDRSDGTDKYSDISDVRPLRIFSPLPLQRFMVGARAFLLVHPPGEMVFQIPATVRHLRGKLAIDQRAYETGQTDGVEFRIDYTSSDGTAAKTLYDRTLKPRERPEDAGVQEFTITLPADGGGRVILRTLPGKAQNSDWDWSGWSDIHFD
jgi:hypothetical protein